MRLTLLPDSSPYTLTIGGATIGCADMAAAVWALRLLFADHRQIATLPEWEVVDGGAGDPAMRAVDIALASFLSDLGNSPLDAWEGARNAIRNSAIGPSTPTQEALSAGVDSVICLGSGPSAARWVPFIREHRNRFVVIVADSSYVGCLRAGIVPDVVSIIERQACMAKLVPADADPRPVLVAPPIVHPDSLRGWDGRLVFWVQNTGFLYDWLAPGCEQDPSGRSAGTLALAIAGRMRARRIYLVGHDLAYDDQRSHSELADPMASRNHAEVVGIASETLHKDAGCQAPDGSTLRTCNFWNFVRQDIANWARTYEHGRVYTTGLSAIPGVESVQEIPVPDHETHGEPIITPAASARRVVDRSAVHQQIALDRASAIDRLRGAATCADRRLAIRLTNPVSWASEDMRPLYHYVLGTVYHAAAIRLRVRLPGDGFDSAFGILRRTIPAMLDRMETDLCA